MYLPPATASGVVGSCGSAHDECAAEPEALWWEVMRWEQDQLACLFGHQHLTRQVYHAAACWSWLSALAV